MASKDTVVSNDGSGGVKGGDLSSTTKPTTQSYKTNALSASKTGKEEEEVTAESIQRQAKERTYTAKATIVGNPHIKSGMLIEIKNVGKKYGGKWWVKTATHRIDSSGYLTDLDLQRDALGSKDGNSKGRDSGVVTSTKKTTNKSSGSSSSTGNKTSSSGASQTTKPSTSGKKLKVDAETGEYYYVDANGKRI